MKKNNKPTYIVDITSCNTANDIIYMFTYEKVNAGLPITMMEYKTSVKNYMDNYNTLEDLITDCANGVVEELNVIADKLYNVYQKPNETEEKKPCVFKRFWNWLTNKK